MDNQSNHLELRTTEILNQDCHCISVDKDVLQRYLSNHLGLDDLPEQLLLEQSNLFSSSPVFLAQHHIEKMKLFISAIESITQNKSYRELLSSPPIAKCDFGTRGVFFAYDFHLTEKGPMLIEINTNAGGVLLNYYLANAQKACCKELNHFFMNETDFKEVENIIINMFNSEWKLERPQSTLKTIAIVDNEPTKQYLYPEFLLFKSMFNRHNIDCIIADPKEFTINDKILFAQNKKIDFVYNRLTDFYFETPICSILKKAYLDKFAIFSPSPNGYGLYADKRNLPILSDANILKKLGIEKEAITIVETMIPKTIKVTPINAQEVWKNRKHLFFKPATGYGSKGVYRGAKITRGVWQHIIESDYLAQDYIVPSTRQLIIDNKIQSLKMDIRCIVYHGEIQQLSARLYQGQTTNLRTKGGGLATVFPVPDFPNCATGSKA